MLALAGGLRQNLREAKFRGTVLLDYNGLKVSVDWPHMASTVHVNDNLFFSLLEQFMTI